MDPVAGECVPAVWVRVLDLCLGMDIATAGVATATGVGFVVFVVDTSLSKFLGLRDVLWEVIPPSDPLANDGLGAPWVEFGDTCVDAIVLPGTTGLGWERVGVGVFVDNPTGTVGVSFLC